MRGSQIVSLYVFVALAIGLQSAARAGYTLTTLVNFNGPNGYGPVDSNGLVLDAQGNIYGTTQGNINLPFGDGTVFEYSPATKMVTTLESFNSLNGTYPLAGLTQDSNGNLFGTTEYNGSPLGLTEGTVFELSGANHSTFDTLATFFTQGTDPFGPSAGVIADSADNLFGVTQFGGASGHGAIYEVTAGNHTLKTLASFSGNNGNEPGASLIEDSQGNLYGTTQTAGTNKEGTVFEYSAATQTISDLATFSGGNGSSPTGNLFADSDGDLFGTTTGFASGGFSTIFEISAQDHSLKTLYTFKPADGFAAVSGLIADSAGNLYGVTDLGGGKTGEGTVFDFNVKTNTFSTLYIFSGADGESVESDLVADSNGNLYGTTEFGGTQGDGTLFELSPTVPEPIGFVSFLIPAGVLLLRRATRAESIKMGELQPRSQNRSEYAAH